MEVVGLAVGVAPLASLCLEILERSRDFKDYKASSLQLNARFELAKSRLRHWTRTVGIADDELIDPHHPLLDQPEVKRAVGIVLNCLLKNFGGSIEDAEVTIAQRHRQAENVPPGWKPIQRSNTQSKLPKSSRSGKNALLWATGQKAVFTEQVDIFEILVERLHEVVPLDKTEIALQSATEALERLKLTQEEMLVLVKQIRQDALFKKVKLIHEWLDAPVVDQDFDKHIRERLQGTCSWLFKNDAYLAWESDDFQASSAKLFWLRAPPGHGKTILAAALTQHIKDIKTPPVAYLFSSPHVGSGATLHAIVRSWIFQLTRADDQLLQLVYNRVIASNALKTTNTEVWDLLREITCTIDGCTLILDGYDEFARQSEMRKDFLHELKEKLTGTKTRVFVSSRPEDDIASELSFPANVPGLSLSGHRIEPKDLEADITLYSAKTVAEQLPNKDQAFQQELANQMSSKCDGMFLWIRLQRLELRDGKSKKKLRGIVDSMPDGLTQSYVRTWDDIMAKSHYDCRRAVEILRWTCFATRPLTVEELTEALVHEYGMDCSCEDDMPDEINESYIDGEIKGLCGSFIEVRKSTSTDGGEKPANRSVHIIHASAKEFLITRLPAAMPVAVKTPEASEHAIHHMHLAEVCLRYLNCDNSWDAFPVDSDDTQPFFAKRLMKYAALGWHAHYKEANMMSDEYELQTSQFFAIDSPYFNRWTRNDHFYKANWTDRRHEAGLNALLYQAVAYQLSHVVDHIHARGKLDFSPTTFTHGSPLAMATWKKEAFFEQFISWGADIHVPGGRDGTVLAVAVLSGNLDRAKLLLDLGADPKIRHWKGRPLLTLACWKDDLKMMKLLLDYGLDPSDYDEIATSPLFWCIDRRKLESVKLLLENGASVTASGKNGQTPLFHACRYDNVEIVNLLLDRGADLLMRTTEEKATPLSKAIAMGNVDVLRALLQREPNLIALCEDPDDSVCPILEAIVSTSVEVIKILLEYGADPTKEQADGLTILHILCEYGKTEALQFLFESGVSVMSRTKNGKTPLHVAAYNGLSEITELLLALGADAYAELGEDIDFGLPIHCAAASGDVKTVRVLLDHGVDVNVATLESWYTALHYACDDQNLPMISFLVENGADLFASDCDGWTPWRMACDSGDLAIVDFFLQRGENASAKADQDWTPLHTACENGDVQVVKHLLGKGADMAETTERQRTPLHAACASGKREVVVFLIERGLNPLQPDSDGITPLHLACMNDGDDALEIVKLLLEDGANVSQQANDGKTSLHYACANTGEKASQIVSHLLELGVDPSQLSRNGVAPLHQAACSGNLDTVRLLLDRDVELPGQVGPVAELWHLMHFAARSGELDMVQFFIEKGVPVNVRGTADVTPLSLAMYAEYDSIVEMLIEAGADVTTPLLQGVTVMERLEGRWPKYKRLSEWRSKVAFQVTTWDRDLWMKHEVSIVAEDALLTEKYPSKTPYSMFRYLAGNFQRLSARSDFIFTSQQALLKRTKSGQVIHNVGCDICSQYPVVGERWLCFTCSRVERGGVDFCGPCKTRLPDVEEVKFRDCAQHDLILVPYFEGIGIKDEDERTRDPEVRDWLTGLMTRYKVDEEMLRLTPIG